MATTTPKDYTFTIQGYRFGVQDVRVEIPELPGVNAKGVAEFTFAYFGPLGSCSSPLPANALLLSIIVAPLVLAFVAAKLLKRLRRKPLGNIDGRIVGGLG